MWDALGTGIDILIKDRISTYHSPSPITPCRRCGWPTDRAIDDISRLEPLDRCWYAGPVGWISRDAAQFVVGIRSGLIEGPRLHLFSGAGIVDGSTPESEWDEIENKISDFLTVLNS